MATAFKKKKKKKKSVTLKKRNLQKAEQHILAENHSADSEMIKLQNEIETVLLKITDIIRCEAKGGYTWVYCINNYKIFTSQNIGKLAARLDVSRFLRIHHHHLVNKEHIKKVNKAICPVVVMSDGSIVTASKRKKHLLTEFLHSVH